MLVTSPRLQDHSEYKTWNPSSGRLQCFKEILPLVAKFLQPTQQQHHQQQQQQQQQRTSQNERLTQLIVKGLLYESCVEYCQARATGSHDDADAAYDLTNPATLLMHTQLSETDASLLSWLHALPLDTFACAFEEKPLALHMERFVKPSLESGAWAHAILAQPIKPQQLFPYSAVPAGRSRNTELMSRSLAPQYEGLSFGLAKSQLFTSGTEINMPTTTHHNHHQQQQQQQQHNNTPTSNLNEITRSIALFNVDAGNPVLPPPRRTTNEPSVSSARNLYQQHHYMLNEIKEVEEYVAGPSSAAAAQGGAHSIGGGGGGGGDSSSSSSMSSSSSAAQKLASGTRTHPAASVNSSRQSATTMQQPPPMPTQLGDKDANSMFVKSSLASSSNTGGGGGEQHNPMTDSALFREYRANKNKINKQLEEQERRRQDYVKQLKCKRIQISTSSGHINLF